MSSKRFEIPRQEGYLVEFKNFSGGVSVKELATTLCAFANTDGGAIYLGVTDSGAARGLRLTTPVLDQIQNAARELCVPPVRITLERMPLGEGKQVLRIDTPKSDRLHSVAAGQCYVRVGSQDKRVLGDELLRLAESKSQVSFEEQLLDAGIEVIDRAALHEYYTARRTVSSIGKQLKPQTLLSRLGLGQQKGRRFRVKAGAFILFGADSDETILQREFTFVRYDSGGDLYAYREDVRLPAERMIQRLVELIRPHNQITTGIEGLRRIGEVLYPEEALREVLLNAFAHRDYRIQGLRNECRLYPDRLEVRSAGGLPSFVTLENLGTRHYSRNPKIMHALVILGLVEELGQGIELMRRALAKNGNPAPEFRATADQVTVTFRPPRRRLSDREITEVLDEHFDAHRTVTRRQIEQLLGIGSTMAKKRIKELLQRGYLQREGSARSTRYRKRS
jgi:ATP-dependent DNA helicase RecG